MTAAKGQGSETLCAGLVGRKLSPEDYSTRVQTPEERQTNQTHHAILLL